MPANREMRRKRLMQNLLDMKKKMWNDLRGEIYGKLGREHSAQFDNPQDVEDLALIDIIEDTGIAVAEIRRREIESIEDALRKIEDGTYGRCVACGKEIEEERLRVMPFAECCMACKCDKETRKKPTM